MNERLLDTKIKILCYGLNARLDVLEETRKQNPFSEKRGGYSDGAFIILGKQLFVNAPVYNDWTKFSPMSINRCDGGFGIFDYNFVCDAELVKPPNWYSKSISRGIPMGRLVQQKSPNQLSVSIRNTCDLYRTGEECKFCQLEYNKQRLLWKDPKQITEVVAEALKANPRYEIVMNSGTPRTPDRGANFFGAVCRTLTSEVDIPIAVEMAPPQEDRYFDVLQNAGVRAIMMNLELNDDNLRRLYCPGKSKLASQERYFAAYKYALKVFGEGQVSSVLLANLERKESTVEGARRLVEAGVIPSILIFRGTDGTPLAQYPAANPEDMKFIYKNVSEMLRDSGLNPTKQTGCMKCRGCSMEGDYYLLS
jgi:radical SAM protein (TIGR04043 family)